MNELDKETAQLIRELKAEIKRLEDVIEGWK